MLAWRRQEEEEEVVPCSPPSASKKKMQQANAKEKVSHSQQEEEAKSARRAEIAREALLLKTFKSRSKADPSLSVADIEGPLKEYRKALTNLAPPQTLCKVLVAPAGVTWKSATPVRWLARLEFLLTLLLEKVPSAILTSRKTKEAFMRLHDSKALCSDKKQVAEVVDFLDDGLRMALAHLRELKLSKSKMDRAVRKCTGADLECLTGMLNRIVINGPEDDEDSQPSKPGDAGDSPAAAGAAASSVVPREKSLSPARPKKLRFDVANAANDDEEGKKKEKQSTIDPAAVFATVLARKKSRSQMAESDSWGDEKQCKELGRSSVPSLMRKGVLVFDSDDDEVDLKEKVAAPPSAGDQRVPRADRDEPWRAESSDDASNTDLEDKLPGLLIFKDDNMKKKEKNEKEKKKKNNAPAPNTSSTKQPSTSSNTFNASFGQSDRELLKAATDAEPVNHEYTLRKRLNTSRKKEDNKQKKQAKKRAEEDHEQGQHKKERWWKRQLRPRVHRQEKEKAE